MAEINDILKIGKEKYLKSNLEQKCENPFKKWIYGDLICFRCYTEEGIIKYEIYSEKTHYGLDELCYIWHGGRDLDWKYTISEADGKFAIKYGIQSYFIWFNYWKNTYGSNEDNKIDFWKDFNKRLNFKIRKLEEKDKNNEDKIFYTEIRLMEELCWELAELVDYDFYQGEKRKEEEDKRKQEELNKKLELEKQEEEARKEKFRFNQRNTHPLDSNISFHASDHTYIVNGIHLESVTTFVNNAFPKFDIEVHAKQKAGKLGISMQEVIEMWEQKGKESRDLGTIMHQKIENYFKGIDSPNDEAFMLFKTFANNFKLSPYRTEWSVYDWDYKIAGTIDFVDYQNGEFSIYDWKRSDKVIANGLPIKNNKYGEKGIYPLENLDNSPYYHYALQLSLYKFILERNYNIKVSKLRLGIFHPSYNKPYILEMPYLEKELNSIFNLRSEIIF